MVSNIYAWYAKHGRKELPWRNTEDSYAILVSEVMLQQTQVKTVLERYYTPFLKAFPTLTSLAEAPIEAVLKQWQGMGYYNRAINLHKAAQKTAPTLPSTVEALMALPGIGQNTAHAVAAFSHHLPVAVMEANVKRILHRVFALSHATDKELWQYATQLLDTSDPFTYNQAMMDIGAMVCTKTSPQCPTCPLQNRCKGKQQPDAYPAKKPKKTTPIRHKYIIVFSHGKYFYVTKRDTRFLNGLFGFQEYAKGKAIIFYNQRYGLHEGEYLGDIQQTYSHFTLNAEVYRIALEDGMGLAPNQWKTLEEIQALPLSKADEKILALL